ncbi:MAG TPA: proline dehydrogenase family protein [Candidatus Acidoferrum sp.]|nr:proline dehydrogenase family protein [Candidatus Acidoferrum sp.]
MRTILLWMARNRVLRERLPRLWFVRRATRRFMPGETADAAFEAAATLAAAGQGILLTRLGENLTALSEADEVAAHYSSILARGATLSRPIEISVKPTQLGLDIDAEACFRHLDALATQAEAAGTWLWLDMEGSSYVDPTLALFERLKASHHKVGIALQAYLKRTAADLHRIVPLGPAVRLVKGAYDEPAAIAYRSRPEIDASYQALALVLAEAARTEASREMGARCALGTHDSALVERIATFAAAAGIPRDRLEVHMLYGIRAAELKRLSGLGFPTSTLIAYGEHWYPWYMRRLAERPANVVFALRQLLP